MKLLESGKDVILDRYAYSGVAYTRAQGLDIQWCESSDVGLPTPDLVIFLSLTDPSTREAFGIERYEVPALQAKVLQVFNERFDGVCKEWSVLHVDGMSIEQVHEKVLEKVDAIPQDLGSVRQLWDN